MIRWRREAIVVLVLATIVHAGMVGWTYARSGSITTHAFRSLDSQEYFRIAKNIAEQGYFSQSDQPPLQPDTWRTPGYPLLLSVLFLSFGPSSAAIILLQQALGILNAILVFRIAANSMSPKRAMIPAIVFLFEPYHLFYSLWIMSETWFVTILLLNWCLWIRILRSPKKVEIATCGALCGLLILIRPLAILVPVALTVGLIFRAMRKETAARSRFPLYVCVLYAMSCLLVTGAWMARNHIVAGRFALSDQGGVVLAYFKAAEVMLWRTGRAQERYLELSTDPAQARQPHTVWDQIDEALREKFSDLPREQRSDLKWSNLAQGNKTSVSSFRVSDELATIGVNELCRSPWNTFACCVSRMVANLTFPLSNALWPPSGVTVNKTTSLALGAIYSAVGLAVFIRLFRTKWTFDQMFFSLACATALILATVPQVDPRFRLPLIPLMVVLALLPRETTVTDRSDR
ncbi:MAG: glycosyltransferase family 39 protein [Planctomycetota bacterium]|mgnify:CR=1 FL=1